MVCFILLFRVHTCGIYNFLYSPSAICIYFFALSQLRRKRDSRQEAREIAAAAAATAPAVAATPTASAQGENPALSTSGDDRDGKRRGSAPGSSSGVGEPLGEEHGARRRVSVQEARKRTARYV